MVGEYKQLLAKQFDNVGIESGYIGIGSSSTAPNANVGTDADILINLVVVARATAPPIDTKKSLLFIL